MAQIADFEWWQHPSEFPAGEFGSLLLQGNIIRFVGDALEEEHCVISLKV